MYYYIITYIYAAGISIEVRLCKVKKKSVLSIQKSKSIKVSFAVQESVEDIKKAN